MNNYLLSGNDIESRSIEVSNLIKKTNFDTATVSTYDLEVNDLSDVLEDLDTYGLFSDKKVVILRNLELFKKSDNEDKYNHLIKYLKNSDSDKLFIIEVNKLSDSIYKELKKLCSLIETSINTKNYIKDSFKGYEIDQNTINLLDSYCLNDISKLKNECDKLKQYKFNEKKITKEDVTLLVEKKLGDSKDLVFAFTRAIGEKNREEALKKYIELLNYNIEPLEIIGMLATQVRNIYQVKILSDENKSNKEIGKILDMHEYRVLKIRELINYYSEKDCFQLMRQLSDIDLRIKTTDTDSNREIELFILNI